MVAASARGHGRAPGAYTLGLAVAALVLFRRRWPLAVLLASAAALQLYGLTNYPGILPAVPLSVAVATAWIAGDRRWTLAIVVWLKIKTSGAACLAAGSCPSPGVAGASQPRPVG